MRRLLIALPVLIGLLATPVAARAAECTLVFTPSTVRVGDVVHSTGTGWLPSDVLYLSIPADPGYESEAQWNADADGNLDNHNLDANAGMLGTRTFSLSNGECVATADLTVLAGVTAPNTDTIASAAPASAQLGDATILLVAFGLTLAAVVRRLRRRPA